MKQSGKKKVEYIDYRLLLVNYLTKYEEKLQYAEEQKELDKIPYIKHELVYSSQSRDAAIATE